MDKKNTRICILGGGSAGLAAGYYLKKNGFQNVTILEKEGRIGGKCESITYQGKSFDLGANYITSSYKLVKKLAKEVGAKMYVEGKLHAFNLESNKLESLLKAVTKKDSFFTVAWQSIKYIWKRYRLSHLLAPHHAGFEGISKHPELTKSFEDWLDKEGLSSLKTLFSIPISLMGYSDLNIIPAVYALTYMRIGTFSNLVMAALSPKIMGYPKRFTEGYERFWDRISWKLNVWRNVEVHRITRDEKVTIEMTVHEQNLNQLNSVKKTVEFDKLILATPLSLDTLRQFLDLRKEEEELFQKIILNPFIVTTYITEGMEDFTAATFMIPEPVMGKPYVVTRQFPDNDLVSFYTRTEYNHEIKKEEILKYNEDFAKKINAKLIGEYYTYDDFPYFPHVDSQAIQEGFYDKLEKMQGVQNTYYVGGLLSFELVECIVNYSKKLVEKHFV
jgi:hypothetical protein